MHGEHARPNGGWQYVTDGNEKYIYETMTGDEWFFDLKNDPQELKNLAADKKHASRVAMWRGRLVEILARRPAGWFGEGRKAGQRGKIAGGAAGVNGGERSGHAGALRKVVRDEWSRF